MKTTTHLAIQETINYLTVEGYTEAAHDLATQAHTTNNPEAIFKTFKATLPDHSQNELWELLNDLGIPSELID